MTNSTVTAILSQIKAAGDALKTNEVGSRETLIDLARELAVSLEYPSEFLQRTFWAEVSSHVILTPRLIDRRSFFNQDVV